MAYKGKIYLSQFMAWHVFTACRKCCDFAAIFGKTSSVVLCPKICVVFLLPFVTRHILCCGGG